VFKVRILKYYSTLAAIILSIAASVWSLLNFVFIFKIKFSKIPINSLKIVQLSGHIHTGQIPPAEIARKYLINYPYDLAKVI
jgi:hypothetical protein